MSKDKGNREVRKPKKDKKTGSLTSSAAPAVDSIRGGNTPKK